MLLQILSDVHLEFDRDGFDFPIKAPYLALLGDIGDPSTETYRNFLLKQSKRYEKVFVIAGNHENYYQTPAEANRLIADICKTIPDKLIHLDKTRFDLTDNIVILGCTLWSNVFRHQKLAAERSVADYSLIRDWTVDKTNEAHSDHVQWLSYAIAEAEKDGKLVIVLTHHAPTFKGTSAPKYENSLITSVFATDLEYMFKSPIVVWSYGHTHYSNDVLINNVRICSNQLGYPDEEDTKYDSEHVIFIDTSF